MAHDFVHGCGIFTFWKESEPEIENIKSVLRSGGFWMEDDLLRFEIDGRDAFELSVYYDREYDEYDVKEALTKLAPFVAECTVHFRETVLGDWRMCVVNGSIREDYGDVWYEDELREHEENAIKRYLKDHLRAEDLPGPIQEQAFRIVEHQYFKEDAYAHLSPYIEAGDITFTGDDMLDELAYNFEDAQDANIPDNETWNFVIEEYIRRKKS